MRHCECFRFLYFTAFVAVSASGLDTRSRLSGDDNITVFSSGKIVKYSVVDIGLTLSLSDSWQAENPDGVDNDAFELSFENHSLGWEGAEKNETKKVKFLPKFSAKNKDSGSDFVSVYLAKMDDPARSRDALKALSLSALNFASEIDPSAVFINPRPIEVTSNGRKWSTISVVLLDGSGFSQSFGVTAFSGEVICLALTNARPDKESNTHTTIEKVIRRASVVRESSQ